MVESGEQIATGKLALRSSSEENEVFLCIQDSNFVRYWTVINLIKRGHVAANDNRDSSRIVTSCMACMLYVEAIHNI